MKILFWGLAIFCSALCLHLVIWKVRIPKAQTKILLQIFLGTLVICLILLRVISSFIVIFDRYTPKIFTEYLHIILFFISLALVYITTYSALEVDSPSLVMVMNIAEGGREGLDKEKFEQIINDDLLVKPRVRDLVADKLIFLDKGRYKLTLRGLLVARIFIFYRKLLRVQKGG